MGLAALATWLLTALGGSYMLGIWIAKGGPRSPRTSYFPPVLIFGHLALAALGLTLWVTYLVLDRTALAWIAFAVLVAVGILGLLMLIRWIPTYRGHSTTACDTGLTRASRRERPEKHFPVTVVGMHGLLATATQILVLLTALGVGSN